MNDLFGLEGRGALVMGAGQGMGRASALLLARCGAKLALVDLERERVENVAREVRALGRPAEALVGDVTSERDVERLVAESTKALGRIDNLVNIIGLATWAPLLEITSDAWDQQHAINLKHHFLVSRAVARQMVAQGGGGAIVVVASVSGMFGAPRHGAYGAAKAGVMALVKTMAQEWEAYGIRVNAIAPGAVRTPRVQEMRRSGQIARGDAAAEAREAEVEDIGSAALFLSSNLARRVNGQTLVVDGGTIARFPFNVA